MSDAHRVQSQSHDALLNRDKRCNNINTLGNPPPHCPLSDSYEVTLQNQKKEKLENYSNSILEESLQ